MFTVHSDKRVAHKLRRIILLRIGLVKLWFYFGKTRQLIIYMISGLWTCRPPQNQLFSTLDTPRGFKYFKKNNIILGKYSFGKLLDLRIDKFKKLEKRRAEYPEDPPNKVLKILNMGSISSRKKELATL